MAKLIHPLFGDLASTGVVVLSFLFVIGLVLDAWWQKRQARLMREWARGRFPGSAQRVTPLRAFFKRFRGTLVVLLAVVSIAILALLTARNNVNASGGNAADDSIAAYATNFQGDATRPVPTIDKQPSVFGDTNQFRSQNLTGPGSISLEYGSIATSGLTAGSRKSAGSNAVTLAVGRGRKR